MTQVWRSNPQFKIETNGTSFINEESLRIELTRPENNVSFAILSINDYRSKNFEAVFDALNSLDISLRYGSDAWTKVFSGTISTVKPRLSMQGEILEVAAWGLGQALVKTHCNTSYGKESLNPTKDTPAEIWLDLVVNYVQKSFGGSNTGYSMGLTYAGGTTPTITFLESAYKTNFDILNLTMELITAAQAGSAGHHWFVEPDGDLNIEQIGNHTGGAWPTYWNGSQAASTIEVTKDMILYDFRKNIEEYANKIVLCTQLRKPGYDYYTEDKDIWGTTTCDLTEDTTNKVVGNCSILAEPANAVDPMQFWYPAIQGTPDEVDPNTNWDFTKIGSEKSIPTINFYGRKDGTLGSFSTIRLFTTDPATNYFEILPFDDYITASGEFFHLNFPIGPYYAYSEEIRRFRWGEQGSPDWANIDGIWFSFPSQSGTNKFWIDDLHFSGKIIREAYDSTAISSSIHEHQRVIRNDTAIDDSMKAADDSGMAAQLCYAELLRRKQTPTVGIIQIPIAVDILPGQLLHIHACKKSASSFRVDKDMRVVELQHIVAPKPVGFKTILNLTDDVNNAHAFGAPTLENILHEYVGALGHAEARNLKGSGIDILVPRLSKDYPS